MMQSNNESSNFRNGNAATPQNGNGNGTLVPTRGGAMEPYSAGMGVEPGNGASAIEPKALLNALRRRWFLAMTVGLFCGGSAATAVYLLVPPEYVAKSTIYIKSTEPSVLAQNRNAASFDTFKRTQMYRAIGRIVLSSALDEPVENKALQSRYKTIADLPLLKANPYPIDWLRTKLSVSGGQEEFFQIKMANSEGPAEIAEIVNAVTHVYLRDVANEDKNAQKQKISQLGELYRDMESKIQEKRRDVQKLGKRLGAFTPETLTLIQQAEIALVSQLQKDRIQLSVELTRLKILDPTGDQSEEKPETEEGIEDKLLDQVVLGEPELAEKLERSEQLQENIRKYKDEIKDPKYPDRVDAENELKTLEESIAKLKIDLRPVAEAKIREAMTNGQMQGRTPVTEQVKMMEKLLAALETELEGHKTTSKSMPSDSFELEKMRSDMSKLMGTAEQVDSQMRMLEIELGAHERIKREEKAEVPKITDMQALYKKCAMAGLGVFGLIVAGIVWFEFQAKRIDSLTDVTGGLSLRIMGALPMMPRWASKNTSKAKGAKSAFWHSVLTESIDATRTVLIRDANVESTRMVMVASAISGEGKTTLSCHLAASLARVGRNTLLVDCDFRRSNVHKVFGVDPKPGLSEVLLGTATLEEAIYIPQDDGPAILPAGEFNSQLLSALAQDGLGTIFQELRKQFEFIVVDSSPVLPVTDSLMVAQHVDAVILSIRRDVSRRPKIIATRDKLAMLGVPILGAVVIGLDGESYGYRAGYQGYGSRYGYGYQYNRAPEATTKS